jgi:hypothetical protein
MATYRYVPVPVLSLTSIPACRPSCHCDDWLALSPIRLRFKVLGARIQNAVIITACVGIITACVGIITACAGILPSHAGILPLHAGILPSHAGKIHANALMITSYAVMISYDKLCAAMEMLYPPDCSAFYNYEVRNAGSLVHK